MYTQHFKNLLIFFFLKTWTILGTQVSINTLSCNYYKEAKDSKSQPLCLTISKPHKIKRSTPKSSHLLKKLKHAITKLDFHMGRQCLLLLVCLFLSIYSFEFSIPCENFFKNLSIICSTRYLINTSGCIHRGSKCQ